MPDDKESLEMVAEYSLSKFDKFLNKFKERRVLESPYFEGVDGGLTGYYQTDINEAYKSLLHALALEVEMQIKDLDYMEVKDELS